MGMSTPVISLAPDIQGTAEAGRLVKRNSDPWFRFYVRTLNNPKAQRLPGSIFKGWVNLLCLAKETDGILPSIEDISFRLRLSEPKIESLLNTLRARGLVEGTRMHDWEEMQYSSDSSTERVKQHRKRLKGSNTVPCNVSSNVSETVQRRGEEIREETEEGREVVKPTIPPVNGSLPPSPQPDERLDDVHEEVARMLKTRKPGEWEKNLKMEQEAKRIARTPPSQPIPSDKDCSS